MQRIKLYKALESELSVKPSRPPTQYTPHITLGYFAAPTQGQQVAPKMKAWNEGFARMTDGLQIIFTSMSLYGFTDMASFFRY